MDHVEIAQQSEPLPQPRPGEHSGSSPVLAPAQGPSALTPAQGSPTPISPFVFALGQVDPRFPSLAVEKEFAHASGRTDTSGQTDRQTLQTVLSDRANRYLARRMCWAFTIEGLDTYILTPRDPADIELLIEAVRAGPRLTDVDVVIGVQGPMAPPEVCNGLVVPVVAFDQLYSFDRDELIHQIPRPENSPEEGFRATAAELLDRIMQMADNAGATDEHRALNFLAVRYPAIYASVAEAHGAESSLTAVEVHPSRLSVSRKIVDVVFTYTNRRTDVADKYFIRVDVEEMFPFLVTRLSPYYERP